jgi:enoyl-CoA hydratase/carnithine racemase
MTILLTEDHGAVRVLTLNRPEKMNAYNVELHNALNTAIQQADNDPNVRVIVVTGAGKAFCAGADISQGFAGAGLADSAIVEDGVVRDFGGILALTIFECDTPIIGAINGVAVGVGATMTLPMDIKIASETTRMGFPFARRGIVFDAASSWFLPRIVGWAKAQELIVRGHIFNVETAHKIGLVSEVVAQDKVLKRAMEIAHDIAQNCSPTSMANNKRLLRASQLDSNPAGGGAMGAHMAESALLNKAFVSADCQEGVAAFLQKRAPNFAPFTPKADEA